MYCFSYHVCHLQLAHSLKNMFAHSQNTQRCWRSKLYCHEIPSDVRHTVTKIVSYFYFRIIRSTNSLKERKLFRLFKSKMMRKLLHWFGNENSQSSSEEQNTTQTQNFNGLAIQVNLKSELCLPRNFITNGLLIYLPFKNNRNLFELMDSQKNTM